MKINPRPDGDHLDVERGGVVTLRSGGALRGEPGALVEVPVPWRTVAGTSYTLSEVDTGQALATTNGSAVTITVPPASSVPFPIGTQIGIAQMGAGQVTIAAGAGVTIRTPETLLLAKQYAIAMLILTATADVWLLTGNLQAA